MSFLTASTTPAGLGLLLWWAHEAIGRSEAGGTRTAYKQLQAEAEASR